MEIQRFDALARQLSQGGSRRRLLGLFGGTALGGLMATNAGPEAEAKKKKKKKSCKKKKCGECQVCQKGKCKPKPNGTACTDGTCENGVCIGDGNCPPERICELSETCCPEPIEDVNGVGICESASRLCSCPAGDQVCSGTEGSQCCLSDDECSPIGNCATDTCSAGNDFCEPEFAVCGDNCGCFSSVGGANLCASFESFSCSAPSQCTTDDNCPGSEICVDVDCRCGGGFRGVCFSACSS